MLSKSRINYYYTTEEKHKNFPFFKREHGELDVGEKNRNPRYSYQAWTIDETDDRKINRSIDDNRCQLIDWYW